MTVIDISYGSTKRLNELAKKYFSKIISIDEHHESESEDGCQSRMSQLNLVGVQNSSFDVDKFLADVCGEFLNEQVTFKKQKKENYWDSQMIRFEETIDEDTLYKRIQIIYRTPSSFVKNGELTIFFKHSIKKSLDN